MPRIVLASQSQSRRRLLEDAGLKPTIIVSNVDEETDFFNAMTPEDMVIALAISKAHTVRELIDYPAIIIGCDSTFDVDGVSFGKPGTPEVAIERAKKISGRTGLLHTGHCVIDTEKGVEISDRVTTKVTFTDMSDEEIADYVASEEPLHVAVDRPQLATDPTLEMSRALPLDPPLGLHETPPPFVRVNLPTPAAQNLIASLGAPAPEIIAPIAPFTRPTIPPLEVPAQK